MVVDSPKGPPLPVGVSIAHLQLLPLPHYMLDVLLYALCTLVLLSCEILTAPWRYRAGYCPAGATAFLKSDDVTLLTCF